MDILTQLTSILASRRDANPENSYVASLYSQGLNKILEKIGEESAELILAAKDYENQGTKSDVINEAADLWFHTLVMLVHLEIPPQEIFDVLESRLGVSGHMEKSKRQP
tara:strand:+ start:1980 stop:2306 length:327 start_codon:yes stop_codon:yes gene_type:complete